MLNRGTPYERVHRQYTSSAPAFPPRIARGVTVGRLKRSFRGTDEGSLWQPDDKRASPDRSAGQAPADPGGSRRSAGRSSSRAWNLERTGRSLGGSGRRSGPDPRRRSRDPHRGLLPRPSPGGGDGDGSASSASRTALDSKFDTARSREAGTARQSEVDLERPLGGQQRVLGRDVARQTGEVDVAVDVRG